LVFNSAERLRLTRGLLRAGSGGRRAQHVLAANYRQCGPTAPPWQGELCLANSGIWGALPRRWPRQRRGGAAGPVLAARAGYAGKGETRATSRGGQPAWRL